MLGVVYTQGILVQEDDVEGARWVRKAADQGFAPAEVALGTAYQLGRGIAKDEIEALKWYMKAANQGSAAAETNVGEMHATGTGTPQDFARSEELVYQSCRSWQPHG
jgi:hypothetical protein